MEKPEYVEKEHLDYLNKLRESGETNMFGAGPYLKRKFKLDKAIAKKILIYWMQSFNDEGSDEYLPKI